MDTNLPETSRPPLACVSIGVHSCPFVVELFSRDLGGAGRAPLVVLHGMLGSSRNWISTGADLAAERHVWALDLRNHGKSPHADSMTYAEMMADVLAWLDAQGIESADFVGHSMGGKVAMLLACRHPTRVASLTVVDIAPKLYQSNRHRAEFAAMIELNLAEVRSRGDAELKMEGRVPDWGMRKFLTTNLERGEDDTWQWTVNLPVIAQALPGLEQNPLGGTDSYDGPVCFVIGGKSRYVQPADHDAIHRHFPAAGIETIEASGHNPHMETRPAFVAAVRRHLG